MAGVGIFFSIPKSFTSGSDNATATDKTFAQKLAGIDYVGAITLVSCFRYWVNPIPASLTHILGLNNSSFPLWPLLPESPLGANCHLWCHAHHLHPKREFCCAGSDHPSVSPEISWCIALMSCDIRVNGCKMDGSLLFTSLRNFSTWMVTSIGGIHPYSYELRICLWWYVGRVISHQTRWKLLVVCSPFITPLLLLLSFACIPVVQGRIWLKRKLI